MDKMEGSRVSMPGATAEDIRAMGGVPAKLVTKPMNMQEMMKNQ